MSDPSLALRNAVQDAISPAQPVFAVVDGAQFDNLPDALRAGEFQAQSLYLDRGDNNPDQVVTAPHLVVLNELSENVLGRAPEETLTAFLELLDGKPAAVFWQCGAGKSALFKHLRGLNMVLYPKSALPPAEVADEDEQDGSPETHERVLFRHPDANVMAQMLIATDESERARLFGPANKLLFSPSPDWAFGSEVVVQERAETWPAAPSGPLTLSEATAARLKDTRTSKMHGKIAAYLKDAAPDKTDAMTDDQLAAHTRTYMYEAKEYGVKSEAGMGRWCFLQLMTDGAMSNDPNVRQLMTTPEPGISPDQRVKLLLRETATALENGAA